MSGLIHNKIIWVFFTIGAFYLFQCIYNRYRFFLLNPVLLSIVAIILFLNILNVPYETYHQGGQYISFLLGPAVVALGLPLYLHLNEIKKRKRAILTSIGVGGLVGSLSAAGIAAIMGASKDVVISMAPKSATAPIAIGILEKIGGIKPLGVAIVIATGVLGAVIGPGLLKASRLKSKVAFGLAMGAASHGIGTARAIEEGEVEGAASGLAMSLNGIATSLMTPMVVKTLMAFAL